VSNRGARYQRGTLKRVGEEWKLRLRMDETGQDGKTVRRERTHLVGSCKEIRTAAQARALADALAERITGRGLNPGASMSAADYLRRYMGTHLRAKKPASQKTLASRIETHLIPGVGRKRIEQVTNQTAQDIVTTMLGKGLHSSTIRQTVGLLSTIWKQARADGLACAPIERRAISMPAKVEADVEQKTFTEAEVIRLVADSSMPWRLAYALQSTLGLRCGEVLGLAWRDFEASRVHLRRSAVRGKLGSMKSRCSAKPMMLPAELTPLLDEHRAAWKPNALGLLFATADGEPIHGDSYRDQLHADLKRLGLPQRGTHAFRHFVATHLLKAGKGLSATRDHMRHSSAAMTNIYAHAVSGDLQDVASYMGNVIGKSV
jgi:integrase